MNGAALAKAARSDCDAFETARLRLVRPRARDREAFRRFNADPAVMQTLGGVKDEAQSDAQFEMLDAGWACHGYGYWVALDRETEAFVGRGGLRPIELDGAPEVEVGYGLVAAAWGRGLATELARAAVEIAFEHIGLDALVCFTLHANRASQRVMEKAGFRYAADIEWASLPHRLCRQRAADGQTATWARVLR